MNKKRSVIDSISKLNQLQLDELLKIVSDNNVAYMENTNGYFIYLKDNLSNKTCLNQVIIE